MKATNIQSYTVKTVFSFCFSISSNLLFHIFMCFLLLAFFLASRFFTTDDLPGLAYCVTWDSFIFSLKILISSLFSLSFCLLNKCWCSRYSFLACLLFFFLSFSIFPMCFSKTDRVFLNSCPLPLLLKCIEHFFTT